MKDNQIIGYKYVNLGKMMENIKKGIRTFRSNRKSKWPIWKF
jgi:hypothetical protein